MAERKNGVSLGMVVFLWVLGVVGLGIVVGVVKWWVERERARFEREDERRQMRVSYPPVKIDGYDGYDGGGHLTTSSLIDPATQLPIDISMLNDAEVMNIIAANQAVEIVDPTDVDFPDVGQRERFAVLDGGDGEDDFMFSEPDERAERF